MPTAIKRWGRCSTAPSIKPNHPLARTRPRPIRTCCSNWAERHWPKMPTGCKITADGSSSRHRETPFSHRARRLGRAGRGGQMFADRHTGDHRILVVRGAGQQFEYPLPQASLRIPTEAGHFPGQSGVFGWVSNLARTLGSSGNLGLSKACCITGGEGGIRTHGTACTHNSFRDCPDRPLWHLSGKRVGGGL